MHTLSGRLAATCRNQKTNSEWLNIWFLTHRTTRESYQKCMFWRLRELHSSCRLTFETDPKQNDVHSWVVSSLLSVCLSLEEWSIYPGLSKQSLRNLKHRKGRTRPVEFLELYRYSRYGFLYSHSKKKNFFDFDYQLRHLPPLWQLSYMIDLLPAGCSFSPFTWCHAIFYWLYRPRSLSRKTPQRC